jgi:hypothetical protein
MAPRLLKGRESRPRAIERNPRERARIAEAALAAAEAALRKGDGVLIGYREALAEANSMIVKLGCRCWDMRRRLEAAGLAGPAEESGEFPF